MPKRVQPRERAKIAEPELTPKAKKVRASPRKMLAALAPAHAQAFRLFCEGSSIRQIGRLTDATRSEVERWAEEEGWTARREELDEAAKAKIERQAVRYLADIRSRGLRVRSLLLKRIEGKIVAGQRVTAQELAWLATASDRADGPVNNPRAPFVSVENKNLIGFNLADMLQESRRFDPPKLRELQAYPPKLTEHVDAEDAQIDESARDEPNQWVRRQRDESAPEQ